MNPLNSTTEQMMARYLLGTASDSECIEVEDRYLRDAEYLTHLRTIEYDLMDDYLRGEMPESDRRQLEQQLHSSPVRLDRVTRAGRVINGLDRLVSEAIPDASVEILNAHQVALGAQSTPWQRFASWFSLPPLAGMDQRREFEITDIRKLGKDLRLMLRPKQ